MTFSANAAYSLCYWLDTATSFPPSTTPPSGWSLTFAPQFQNQNYAVILQNDSDETQLAVVILGTHDLAQIAEDFGIGSPGPFVNASNQQIISGAQIANGASSALSNVLQLEDNNGQTFESVLSSYDWSTYSVLITGHSLGGTIASLLAPWLASLILDQAPLTQPLPSQIQAVTFAAFAAGNQEFASYLNSSSQYQANVNVNDIVPYVWAATGDYSVNHIYTTFPSPGPAIPEATKVGLKAKVATIPKGFQYIQTNEPNTFTGTILQAPSFSQCKNPASLQWEWEVSVQHNYAYCVNYIGSGCSLPSSDCPKS